MTSILLLLSCTIINVLPTQSEEQFAPTIPKCEIDNDVCVTNAVKVAYPMVLEPDAKIGAEEMDPLFQELIEGNSPVLKFKFRNTTINGFKTCEVQTAKFIDKNRDFLRVNLLCPTFKIYGLYEAKGKLITKYVEGNGDFVLNISQYSITLDLEIKFTVKHGKSIKTIKSFKTEAEVLGKATFDFRNLFNGQKDLAESVLKFANKHWKPIMDELQYPVLEANLGKIIKNANAYMAAYQLLNKL